jgi:hypothetical protein
MYRSARRICLCLALLLSASSVAKSETLGLCQVVSEWFGPSYSHQCGCCDSYCSKPWSQPCWTPGPFYQCGLPDAPVTVPAPCATCTQARTPAWPGPAPLVR